VDTWFFGVTSNFGDKQEAFLDGMKIEGSHRSVSFTGRSDQSLIVSFEPSQNQCLYVIRPEDRSFRKLPALLKEASALSALDRIDVSAEAFSPFLEAIGVTYPEDWCTFYQRADLARQRRDYADVLALWQEAKSKGFSPDAFFEYMPFIDAYVQVGRWEDAIKLTLETSRRFPISRLTSCDYWNALPASPGKEAALKDLTSRLDCFNAE